MQFSYTAQSPESLGTYRKLRIWVLPGENVDLAERQAVNAESSLNIGSKLLAREISSQSILQTNDPKSCVSNVKKKQKELLAAHPFLHPTCTCGYVRIRVADHVDQRF